MNSPATSSQGGYRAEALHGDLSQAMRERVMGRFRKRQCEFLVATDVAARGLDVDDVEVVFNYDLPHDGEDYVHRVGRTGRAGRKGKAITFVAGREIYRLQNIQRFTKARIQRQRVPSLDEVEERRTESLFERLRETLEAGNYRRQDAALDRLLEGGFAPTDIASALVHLLAYGSEKPGPAALPVPAAKLEAPDRSPPPRAADEREGERPAPARARDKGERKFGAASHEAGMSRLVFNVGKKHDVLPGDIVGVVAGVTRLGKEVVGAIHILPRQAFVDVASEHEAEIRAKLNGIRFKGQKLLVEPADPRAN